MDRVNVEGILHLLIPIEVVISWDLNDTHGIIYRRFTCVIRLVLIDDCECSEEHSIWNWHTTNLDCQMEAAHVVF